MGFPFIFQLLPRKFINLKKKTFADRWIDQGAKIIGREISVEIPNTLHRDMTIHGSPLVLFMCKARMFELS